MKNVIMTIYKDLAFEVFDFVLNIMPDDVKKVLFEQKRSLQSLH